MRGGFICAPVIRIRFLVTLLSFIGIFYEISYYNRSVCTSILSRWRAVSAVSLDTLYFQNDVEKYSFLSKVRL